jgi:hypothetical protein
MDYLGRRSLLQKSERQKPTKMKENIKKQVKNELTQETVRKLKTEEARKIASSPQDQEDDSPSRSSQGKKINRPANNIFKRA